MNETVQISWEERIPATPDATEVWATEVQRRCEESGWSCVRRHSGRLTVALETRPALHVTLTPAAYGLRLVLELADFSALPGICRAAADALIGDVVAHLPILEPLTNDPKAKIGFQTTFTEMPESESLAASFAAQSTAASLSAEAIEALQNETLARDYLAIRGHSAESQKQKQRKDNT